MDVHIPKGDILGTIFVIVTLFTCFRIFLACAYLAETRDINKVVAAIITYGIPLLMGVLLGWSGWWLGHWFAR